MQTYFLIGIKIPMGKGLVFRINAAKIIQYLYEN